MVHSDPDLILHNSSVLIDKEPLYKGYPNHVMDKVARKFPDMKIIKVHGFRKTHATLLFEAGAQVKDVQDRLGHSSSKTTMDIYIKVSKNRQNETVELFDSYMNG